MSKSEYSSTVLKITPQSNKNNLKNIKNTQVGTSLKQPHSSPVTCSSHKLLKWVNILNQPTDNQPTNPAQPKIIAKRQKKGAKIMKNNKTKSLGSVIFDGPNSSSTALAVIGQTVGKIMHDITLKYNVPKYWAKKNFKNELRKRLHEMLMGLRVCDSNAIFQMYRKRYNIETELCIIRDELAAKSLEARKKYNLKVEKRSDAEHFKTVATSLCKTKTDNEIMSKKQNVRENIEISLKIKEINGVETLVTRPVANLSEVTTKSIEQEKNKDNIQLKLKIEEIQVVNSSGTISVANLSENKTNEVLNEQKNNKYKQKFEDEKVVKTPETPLVSNLGGTNGKQKCTQQRIPRKYSSAPKRPKLSKLINDKLDAIFAKLIQISEEENYTECNKITDLQQLAHAKKTELESSQKIDIPATDVLEQNKLCEGSNPDISPNSEVDNQIQQTKIMYVPRRNKKRKWKQNDYAGKTPPSDVITKTVADCLPMMLKKYKPLITTLILHDKQFQEIGFEAEEGKCWLLLIQISEEENYTECNKITDLQQLAHAKKTELESSQKIDIPATDVLEQNKLCEGSNPDISPNSEVDNQIQQTKIMYVPRRNKKRKWKQNDYAGKTPPSDVITKTVADCLPMMLKKYKPLIKNLILHDKQFQEIGFEEEEGKCWLLIFGTPDLPDMDLMRDFLRPLRPLKLLRNKTSPFMLAEVSCMCKYTRIKKHEYILGGKTFAISNYGPDGILFKHVSGFIEVSLTNDQTTSCEGISQEDKEESEPESKQNEKENNEESNSSKEDLDEIMNDMDAEIDDLLAVFNEYDIETE